MSRICQALLTVIKEMVIGAGWERQEGQALNRQYSKIETEELGDICLGITFEWSLQRCGEEIPEGE